MVDISEAGAAVMLSQPLPAGTSGALQADRIGMTLPFVVRSTENDMMYLTSGLGEAGAARFALILGGLSSPRAA